MTRSWILIALLVCGCAGTDPEERDRGPDRPRPELAALPDPVPRDEPRSRYGNHSPYVVFGKTYRVMDSRAEYAATGIASWYGTKFQGRPTSSGEPYDMFELTAAHRSLPLPTYLRVTNLDNGRSSIVRVNDRGPFHDDRIIDLSYAAAVKLGFADHGTARVRVALAPVPAGVGDTAPAREIAGVASIPATGLASVPDTGAVPELDEAIFLQAGAFSRRRGAEQLHNELTALVGGGVKIDQSAEDALFRVRVGPVPDMTEASRLQSVIVGAELGTPLIIRESN